MRLSRILNDNADDSETLTGLVKDGGGASTVRFRGRDTYIRYTSDINVDTWTNPNIGGSLVQVSKTRRGWRITNFLEMGSGNPIVWASPAYEWPTSNWYPGTMVPIFTGTWENDARWRDADHDLWAGHIGATTAMGVTYFGRQPQAWAAATRAQSSRVRLRLWRIPGSGPEADTVQLHLLGEREPTDTGPTVLFTTTISLPTGAGRFYSLQTHTITDNAWLGALRDGSAGGFGITTPAAATEHKLRFRADHDLSATISYD